MFFARHENHPQPWTNDLIIQTYKFTNAYRASDRVSQYLIRNVIYNGEWSLEDTFFRILLFKLFNKIETWQMLEHILGEISLKTFNVDKYDKLLMEAKLSKAAIYSAAYIIPSGSRKKFGKIKKHKFHLMLLEKLIKTKFPERIKKQQTMKEGFEMLLDIESFGNFLAYQYITDLNYSSWFDYSEEEFVIPGPGAKDGIRKCFSDLGDYSEEDIIKMMADWGK